MSTERKSIFGRFLRPKPAEQPDPPQPAHAGAPRAVPRTAASGLDCSLLDAEVDDNWTACIDFGTAFSKIVMVRRHETGATTTEHVRPLQIGPTAMPGFSPLMCPSALYVLQERIHFGERAFIVHANHGANTRQRFESPKHYISALNQQLLETPASDAEDPTQRFTRAQLLSGAVAVRDVTLHRHGCSVDGVRVRAHGRRFACRLEPDLPAGRHARVSVQLEDPAERTAPGQLACLYADEVVVGYGTIAA